MKRLLASGLLPARAGQPVKALVHVTFADLRDLCDLDVDSKVQEAWIGEYRARRAAQRAAASVSTGDSGAWLEGDAARAVACDAMIIPVVTGDIDPGAVEVLIALCVQYERIRSQAPDNTDGTDHRDGPDGPAGSGGRADAGDGTVPADGTDTRGDAAAPAGSAHSPAAPTRPDHSPAAPAERDGRTGQVLAMLEHQILATVLQIVSGPGGVASFLRWNLLGKGLNGPSLPLDVGQP